MVSQGDIFCPSCGRNPRENPPPPGEALTDGNRPTGADESRGKTLDSGGIQGKDWQSLLEQARKCLEQAKAYSGKQQRAQARREYQRAYGYFEDVLKIEPNSQEAREGKSQCLRKMV